MIHDEICTYEVCKLAKEKGFPQHPKDNDRCQIYCWDGLRHIHSLDIWEVWFYDEHHHDNLYAAPSQSLLQRWLREEKGIIIELKYSDSTESFRPFWSWQIYNTLGITLEIGEPNTTYELALEDALKYALELV